MNRVVRSLALGVTITVLFAAGANEQARSRYEPKSDAHTRLSLLVHDKEEPVDGTASAEEHERRRAASRRHLNAALGREVAIPRASPGRQPDVGYVGPPPVRWHAHGYFATAPPSE